MPSRNQTKLGNKHHHYLFPFLHAFAFFLGTNNCRNKLVHVLLGYHRLSITQTKNEYKHHQRGNIVLTWLPRQRRSYFKAGLRLRQGGLSAPQNIVSGTDAAWLRGGLSPSLELKFKLTQTVSFFVFVFFFIHKIQQYDHGHWAILMTHRLSFPVQYRSTPVTVIGIYL